MNSKKGKWTGKKLTGQKCFFEVGNMINHGGNGDIYEIQNIGSINLKNKIDFSSEKCVMKILKDKYKGGKRYDRFKKEILVVEKCQETILGIMKILDYHLGSKKRGQTKTPFYLMYYAESFLAKCSSMTINDKLNNLLKIGKTLKEFHSFGKEIHALNNMVPTTPPARL